MKQLCLYYFELIGSSNPSVPIIICHRAVVRAWAQAHTDIRKGVPGQRPERGPLCLVIGVDSKKKIILSMIHTYARMFDNVSFVNVKL